MEGWESRWVLWVLFSETTAANSQIFYLFSHSPVYFWRSRGQQESWQILGHCVISTFFTHLQFSLVLGPSGMLHHSCGHEVLKGFSSDGDITHHITSVNTGFRSYWQESSFSEELTSCIAIKFQHHFLGFFPSISVEGKVSNGLWRGQQIRWLATGSFICWPQSLFVDQVNLFLIICLFFLFQTGDMMHDSDLLGQTRSLWPPVMIRPM